MKNTLLVTLILLVFSVSIVSAEEYLAPKMSDLTIDGVLDDWADVSELEFGEDTWEANGGNWEGESDLNLTLMIGWNDDNLFVASIVQDDVHINTQTDAASIWNGDSVQYMIDPTGNLTDTQDVVYEFGFALAGEDSTIPMSYRWLQNANAPADFESEFVIVRDNVAGTTTYEVRIPEAQVAPAEFSTETMLGFGTIVNDGDPDAEGQGGWVGWGSQAIVGGKDATQLQELVFSAPVTAVKPSSKLATTWANLKY